MKVFVLDTSVLLYDPSSIFKFGKNIVQIPLVVIEELDRFKRDPNENGRNARTFSRYVDQLRKKGSIAEGVKLDNGGEFLISMSKGEGEHQHPYIDLSFNDNIILSCALEAKRAGREVILITRDINLRLKADVLGIRGDDYGAKNITLDEIYTGSRILDVAESRLLEFEKNRFLSLGDEEREQICANEYIILQEKDHPNHRLLGRFSLKKRGVVPLVRRREGLWGVYPKNVEQEFAIDALLCEDMKLVSLTGKAGTGKTLLAIAAGLELSLNQQSYSRILISRPIMPVGRDIGFLPGDIKEKFSPWMQPVFDNLDFIFGKKVKTRDATSWESMMDQGVLYVEPLTYIRGRSIPHQYLLIDESQNLSPHEIKTIITRAGEGTKIVLTGDCEQVDSPYLDSINNGLTYCVEKFKGEDIKGHILLRKGERSALSEIACKLL